MNIFGSYNYNYRKGLNHLILNQNFFNNGIFYTDDKDIIRRSFQCTLHLKLALISSKQENKFSS